MNVSCSNKNVSFPHRWTHTRFGLKAPGRPVLTKEWHLMPSWLVESSTQFALSIRMTTARQEVTLWCTPTTPTVVERNPSTLLFPTPISTFPPWTTIQETTSFTYGTITMCYDMNWSLDRRIQLQVRSPGSLAFRPINCRFVELIGWFCEANGFLVLSLSINCLLYLKWRFCAPGNAEWTACTLTGTAQGTVFPACFRCSPGLDALP